MMRRYWDRGARENAFWYVDTSLSFENPDLDSFRTHGQLIAADFLRHFQPDPERHVALEIGCGLGRVVEEMAPHFRHVVGTDISTEMLRKARTLVETPNHSFVLVDGEGLSCVRSASMDLVVSFAVLQHIPSVRQALDYIEEVARVLKPGGQMAVHFNTWKRTASWAARRTAFGVMNRIRPSRDPRRTTSRYFMGSTPSVRRIRRRLVKAGLKELEVGRPGTLFTMVYARKPMGPTAGSP
jgi:ubiquinone/menaquinone biosynthesis C-methylase UbiE